MKTVRELSKLTGISVRTLHYYDEIGLLPPTLKNEAGYRLYDDRAVEALQQILFFREFDLPLKEIKQILQNPALEKEQILRMQRSMLVMKKQRLERLIAGIDEILKGENTMSFEIFDKTEIEELYRSMAANMTEEQQQIFVEQYGSMDAFHEYFVENASSEQAQKNFETIVQWYGSKEAALNASKNPGQTELLPALQQRLSSILQSLAGQQKTGAAAHSPEVRELVKEYVLVSRQLFQMEDVSQMLLDTARLYQDNPEIQKSLDSIYGEGTTRFFGEAFLAFYEK